MLSKFSFYFGFTKIILSYFLFSLKTVLLPWQPHHHHPILTGLAKTRLSLVSISFALHTSPTFSHKLLFFKNIEKELLTIDWHWFFFLKSKTSWLWHLSCHTYQTIFLPTTDLFLCSLASFLISSGFLAFIILKIVAQINTTKLGLKTSLASL